MPQRTCPNRDRIRDLQPGETAFFPGMTTKQTPTHAVARAMYFQRTFTSKTVMMSGVKGTKVTRIK